MIRASLISTLLLMAAPALATAQEAPRGLDGYGRHFETVLQSHRHVRGMWDIQRRVGVQQRRIAEGRRSGQLTRWEYFRLQARQADIRDAMRHAARDGIVHPFERARLHAMLDASSQAIRREKHDAQTRDRWRRIGRAGRGWWF